MYTLCCQNVKIHLLVSCIEKAVLLTLLIIFIFIQHASIIRFMENKRKTVEEFLAKDQTNTFIINKKKKKKSFYELKGTLHF